MMAGKTSHTASYLFFWYTYSQHLAVHLLIYLASKQESEITNYLYLLQAIYRGKDFVSPLLFSLLFQHLSKALAYLHTFVVVAEGDENCTSQSVATDGTPVAKQCGSCGHARG